MTIDHENCCDGVDGRDGPENDKRRARHAPEPLSICAQRRADHFPRARTAVHLLGSDQLRHLPLPLSIIGGGGRGGESHLVAEDSTLEGRDPRVGAARRLAEA